MMILHCLYRRLVAGQTSDGGMMVTSVYQRWVLTGSPLRTVGKCKEVGWLVANQQDLSPGPGTTGQHRLVKSLTTNTDKYKYYTHLQNKVF